MVSVSPLFAHMNALMSVIFTFVCMVATMIATFFITQVVLAVFKKQ